MATPLPGVALVPGVGAAGVAGGAGVVPLVAAVVDDGVAAATAAVVVVVVTVPVAAGEAARDSRPPWSLRQANTRSNASSLVRVASASFNVASACSEAATAKHTHMQPVQRPVKQVVVRQYKSVYNQQRATPWLMRQRIHVP